MLKEIRCSLDECNNILKSFQEVALGMCEFHRNLLTSNRHYVGICWNCNRITGIYEVPRHLLGILTEKYLFSKGCSKCSNSSDADIAWITLKKFVASRGWAINDEGKLIIEDRKVVTT